MSPASPLEGHVCSTSFVYLLPPDILAIQLATLIGFCKDFSVASSAEYMVTAQDIISVPLNKVIRETHNMIIIVNIVIFK